MNIRPASFETDIPDVTVRSRRLVRLGPLLLELRSNDPEFTGYRFFVGYRSAPADISAPSEAPHFTVTLCDLRIDTPCSKERLAALRDRTYRGGRMAGGYYLNDHFGAPAWLLTRACAYWIFAEDFTGILWPYVVKYLLTIFSIQNDMLHIKAAAIGCRDRGALLVGRGGGGKTVLLTRLCSAGGAFLSNTHCLIREERVLGIPTTMRVRRDQFFGHLIDAGRLPPSVKPDEFVVDPCTDLAWSTAPSAVTQAICLVDYRGPQVRRIEKIDKGVIYEYLEQFSLAVNVYGLKEDILDHVGSDVQRMAEVTAGMRARLRRLVDRCSCYHISCDAADERNLHAIRDVLQHG